jgi:hypothetical protein
MLVMFVRERERERVGSSTEGIDLKFDVEIRDLKWKLDVKDFDMK